MALLSGLAASPANALDYTDVSILTGATLKEQLSKLAGRRDFSAALKYFDERKLSLDVSGLAQVSFRTERGFHNLFFVPYNEPKGVASAGTDKHVIVSAEGPKGTSVFVGTITTKTKPAEVKEEKIVIEGKLVIDKGQLKSFLKCALVGCGAGATCLVSGPVWLPCLCVTCGSSVIACGLAEYLFP